MTYEECKAIAIDFAKKYGASVDKAYSLFDDAFVFDNSKEEWMGILPVVVDVKEGKTHGLWQYLGEKNLTMDDMIEVSFEG